MSALAWTCRKWILQKELSKVLYYFSETGRLLVINEDTEVTNFGEHVIRKVMDEAFYSLEVKPELLAGLDVPGVGLAWGYEQHSVPQADDVLAAMRRLATQQA